MRRPWAERAGGTRVRPVSACVAERARLQAALLSPGPSDPPNRPVASCATRTLASWCGHSIPTHRSSAEPGSAGWPGTRSFVCAAQLRGPPARMVAIPSRQVLRNRHPSDRAGRAARSVCVQLTKRPTDGERRGAGSALTVLGSAGRLAPPGREVLPGRDVFPGRNALRHSDRQASGDPGRSLRRAVDRHERRR
jgi:hypothetical protein